MEAKLKGLRERIDELDSKIIHLLGRRLKVANQIGDVKAKMGFKRTTDKIRESEMKKMRYKLAKIHNLDRKFTEEIFSLVIEESKRLENHT